MFARLRWMWTTTRLGPDVFLTHWMLHFPSLALRLCRHRFARFGNGAAFRPYAFAVRTDHIHIGDNVVIRPGCFLMAGEEDNGLIVIEDDVLIGPGVHIYCDNHAFGVPDVPILRQGSRPSEPVTIKRGAWIGAQAILLPGVTIGENAVVGAGSVVRRDVSARNVAVGNPARAIRSIEKENT